MIVKELISMLEKVDQNKQVVVCPRKNYAAGENLDLLSIQSIDNMRTIIDNDADLSWDDHSEKSLFKDDVGNKIVICAEGVNVQQFIANDDFPTHCIFTK